MESELPTELRLAVTAAPDGAVKVVDQATHQAFYLVTATVFEELQRALRTDSGVRDFEPLLADLSPEDWEDASHYDSPSS